MKQVTKVAINATTLDALKQMLFSKTGIDMTPIVDDLSGNQESVERNLTAINVGLVMSGFVPSIDQTTCFGSINKYWKRFEEYRFESYSLIRDMVTVQIIRHEYDEKEEAWKLVERDKQCFSLESWYELSTDISSEVKKEIGVDFPDFIELPPEEA